MDSFHAPETDHLYNALLTLKTPEECRRFLEDICTIQEIQEMTRRLEVARQLRQGRIYNDIAKDTGASTATISRVNRCLNYGSGGYSTVLDRLEKPTK